ncbi:MAG: hypothetical protein M3422_10680, partial [Actinomycetota bacterium]|nr:hypothetical protein [Actinomycetota bacterium]
MIDAPVTTRSPFAAAPVTLVATTLFAVLMAVSPRYGYHRDELYLRLLGEQPATGYFDTPPLTPMVAKLSIALFGDNLGRAAGGARAGRRRDGRAGGGDLP